MPNSTLEKPELRTRPNGHNVSAEPPPPLEAYTQVDTLFRRPHTPAEERWLKIARQVSDEFSQTAPDRYRRRAHPAPELKRLHESGLAALLVREERGGGGANWAFAIEIVREIAAGDGSLGVLLMHHFLAVHGFGWLPEPFRSRLEDEIVKDKVWIGNGGVNPLDPDIVATPLGNGKFALNGRKTFCTGGAVADRLMLMARRADTREIIHVFITPDRPGIKPGGDWDAVGLPLADSGSFTYNDAVISEHEFTSRGETGPAILMQSSTAPKYSHLGFDNVYLGIAIGALRTARAYIHTTTRPWVTSGVEKAADDPYIIFQLGEFWARIEAAIAISNHASLRAQALIDSPPGTITEKARGEVAASIATFKILATQASVEITSKLFELMGARSTAAKYGFDRFWRDARTYSLHHPYNYKVKEVGDYALNGKYPPITFYS